jgi:hypothetical protein
MQVMQWRRKPSRRPSRRAARNRLRLLVAMTAISVTLGFSLWGGHIAHASAPRRGLNAHLQYADVPPGDVFMQALITQNTQLAWEQLCPALQQKVPASDLANPADALKVKDANQDVQLGVFLAGARPWKAGGEIRVYVITAQGPSGTGVRALYALHTGANGCVDSVLGE